MNIISNLDLSGLVTNVPDRSPNPYVVSVDPLLHHIDVRTPFADGSLLTFEYVSHNKLQFLVESCFIGLNLEEIDFL